MKLIKNTQYQFEMLKRWVREQKLKFLGIDRKFYCQRAFEGESKCTYQCDHYKKYYKPLEGN